MDFVAPTRSPRMQAERSERKGRADSGGLLCLHGLQHVRSPASHKRSPLLAPLQFALLCPWLGWVGDQGMNGVCRYKFELCVKERKAFEEAYPVGSV